MKCLWCKKELSAGSMCAGCVQALYRKTVHVRLDTHVEMCGYCRHGGSMCEHGYKLYIEAQTEDGRIDKEYAEVFGKVDPVLWYQTEGVRDVR